MTKPTKIRVDGKCEYMDIYELQITFTHNEKSGEPYNAVTFCDSEGGTMTFPLGRVELITE